MEKTDRFRVCHTTVVNDAWRRLFSEAMPGLKHTLRRMEVYGEDVAEWTAVLRNALRPPLPAEYGGVHGHSAASACHDGPEVRYFPAQRPGKPYDRCVTDVGKEQWRVNAVWRLRPSRITIMPYGVLTFGLCWNGVGY